MPEFKAPDIKVPDFKAPDFKAPDIKVPDFKAPDVKVPEFKAPAVKAPEFSAPKFAVPDAPKFSVPSGSYDLSTGGDDGLASQEVRDSKAKEARGVYKEADAEAKVSPQNTPL